MISTSEGKRTAAYCDHVPFQDKRMSYGFRHVAAKHVLGATERRRTVCSLANLISPILVYLIFKMEDIYTPVALSRG